MALRDLGMLAALGNGGAQRLSAEEVAAKASLPLYGVKVLLEAGAVTDLVALDAQRFRLTTLGLLVLQDTMTRVNMDFTADVCYRGMGHLQDAVRSGAP